jgi:STE24 endopeptidase
MFAAFVAAYVAVLVATLAFNALNLRHQRAQGHRVPAELTGTIEPERLARIEAYTHDRARLGMIERAFGGTLGGIGLFSGVLAVYDRWVAELAGSRIERGALFMLGLVLASALVGLPFSYYRSFVVEARHGFNRMTRGLFFADWFKGTGLSLAFVFALSALGFWLIGALPGSWWLWVWLAFVAFSLVLTFVSPYLIEPLFFRMEPLKVEGLADEVRALAERANVHVGRVLQVDASRRSAHSNAYFTGLGRVKRVVLFDTLLAQMTHAEILAVLAHELGHWKKHHVRIRTLVGFGVSLALAYIVFRAAPAPFVPKLVGLADASLPARFVILAALGSVLSFALTPLGSAWSRHDEWQADAFAADLADCAPALASALAKLARENLSNLHPHPLYAKFYYSHPPVTERIERLRSRGREPRPSPGARRSRGRVSERPGARVTRPHPCASGAVRGSCPRCRSRYSGRR